MAPPTQDPGTFASIFKPTPTTQVGYQQQQQPQQQHQFVDFNPSGDAYSHPEVPSVQTYSTYPQVQIDQNGGTSVTTPISLPGMPPITVSTTIPSTQQYDDFANQKQMIQSQNQQQQ